MMTVAPVRPGNPIAVVKMSADANGDCLFTDIEMHVGRQDSIFEIPSQMLLDAAKQQHALVDRKFRCGIKIVVLRHVASD